MMTLPSYVPAIRGGDGFATIARVNNLNPDGTIWHDTVNYDIRIVDGNSVSPILEAIRPANKWMQSPRIKCMPPEVGSEWPCRISNTRLLLWVWETPAVGPCNGETPGDPSGDGTPAPGPGPRPIGPDIPVFGSPMTRLLMRSTDHELAAFYRAAKAAAGGEP